MPKIKTQKPLLKKLRHKIPSRVFKNKLADFALGFCGLMLAAGSAYLPWYVHNHSEEFSPPRMEFTGQIDPQEPEIDLMTTASVPKHKPQVILGKRPERDFIKKTRRRIREVAMDKPKLREGDGSITVLFASRGRALVNDDGEIVMVEPGMVLSNGSKVAQVLRKGNTWEITTSDKKILRWKQ